jgi:tetratricopeptide (TPR) repeat protein
MYSAEWWTILRTTDTLARKMKRIKLYIWPALAIQVCFWISLHNGMLDGFFNDTMHRVGQGGDFYQFYQAGANLVRGESIYQYEESPDIPYGPKNKYPPMLVAVIGVPAQVLSPKTAYFIWRLAIAAMFALMLAMIRRIVGPGHFQGAAALSLAFTPFYLDLYHGQTNTLMALLVAWIMMAFATSKKPRTWPQLAVSWNVKMNTLLLVPVYTRRERIRDLALAIGLGAVLFFPYFAFFPRDLSYFARYAVAAPVTYVYQAGNLGMAPVVQEIANLFTYDEAVIGRFVTAVSAAVIALSLWVFYKARHRDALDHVSLWICTFFIGFRFVWEHHLVMLLPVLALELVRNRKSVIVLVWILLALPTIFALIDIDLGTGYYEVQRYWTGRTSLFYHLSKLVPLIWLYLAVVLRLLDRKINVRAMVLATAAVLLVAWVGYTVAPHTSKDYMALALTAEKANRFDEADAYFKKSIDVDRKYIDSFFFYTEFLLDRGRMDEARRIRDMAREIAPNHPVFKAAGERK